MQHSFIRKLQIIILIGVTIAVILVSLTTILIKNNKNQAEQTSVVIMNQLQRIIPKNDDVAEVVSSMPTYDGIQIIIADKATKKICGATNEELLHQDLVKTGIDIYRIPTEQLTHFISEVNGRKQYCALQEKGNYYFVVMQSMTHVNKSLPMTILIVFIYLMLIARVVLYVVKKMTNRIIHEYELANKDIMTGLLNRQAYENAVAGHSHDVPCESDFVYVLADLNGLKTANDNLGHGAGDELIQGAAQCLKQHLGVYGDVYRVGGDEFVAVIYADKSTLTKLKKELDEAVDLWDGFLVHKLSISYGFVEKREFPDASIGEIMKIADERMYKAKKEYYERSGIERRH